MLAKMTIKGQIQIPSSIRKQFNMQSWQLHDIEIIGNKIVITPAPDANLVRKQLKDNLYTKGFTDETLRKLACDGLG